MARTQIAQSGCAAIGVLEPGLARRPADSDDAAWRPSDPARGRRMADIFISYTASDRDWAFWIAKELEALGQTPHVHEWEIKGGEDIYAWMEERHDAADHVLCVV